MMSYLNKVWVAASAAAAAQSHTDQGIKLNAAGVRTLAHRAKERIAASSSSSIGIGLGIAPAAGAGVARGAAAGGGSGTEDSLRKALFISCWGPS